VWYNGSPLCREPLHGPPVTCVLTSDMQRYGGLHSTKYLCTPSRSRPIIPSLLLPTRRFLASQPTKEPGTTNPPTNEAPSPTPSADSPQSSGTLTPTPTSTAPSDWEDNPNYAISQFSELPHSNFGVNQHIVINDEFKEALRQILWQFRAPIRYAFAYGSGVFPQSKPVCECSSNFWNIQIF
jgi:translocator assembly and maintenance protein 41